MRVGITAFSFALSVIALAVVAPAGASAEEAPEGLYKQQAVNVGPGSCPTCTITITKLTPHIIQIASNNNWIGNAVYDGNKYTGRWEWKAGTGGSYEGQVFTAQFVYTSANGILAMIANSSSGKIEAFYHK